MAKKKKFDSESSGYDYEAAKECGLGPDESGHWPSRCPSSGQILKGKGHKTWTLTVDEEKRMGYNIYKKNGKYYSKKGK
tara:strand:- start:1567 stop:1803 length:237 start_codon:yes stop_codon:yes gene_type:complete